MCPNYICMTWSLSGCGSKGRTDVVFIRKHALTQYPAWLQFPRPRCSAGVAHGSFLLSKRSTDIPEGAWALSTPPAAPGALGGSGSSGHSRGCATTGSTCRPVSKRSVTRGYFKSSVWQANKASFPWTQNNSLILTRATFCSWERFEHPLCATGLRWFLELLEARPYVVLAQTGIAHEPGRCGGLILNCKHFCSDVLYMYVVVWVCIYSSVSKWVYWLTCSWKNGQISMLNLLES